MLFASFVGSVTGLVLVTGLMIAGLTVVVGWMFLAAQPSAEALAFTQLLSTEQRKAPRRQVPGVPVVLTPALGMTLDGWILNHSAGGLCVSVAVRVATGTIFTVSLATGDADTPTAQVRVKRCTRDQDHWVLGCRFAEVPCQTVLKQLG